MALEKVIVGNSSDDKGVQIEDKKYEEIDWVIVDDDVKMGGFKLVLVTEVTNTERAIRIVNSDKLPGDVSDGHQVADGSDFYEVKAGDSSGTVASGDSRFKYDMKRVDYCKSNEFPLKLIFMKPTIGPIWSIKCVIEIPKVKRTLLGGKTLYVYWSKDAEPRIFDDKTNRIKKGKLV